MVEQDAVHRGDRLVDDTRPAKLSQGISDDPLIVA
jgi:hypothetical protein